MTEAEKAARYDRLIKEMSRQRDAFKSGSMGTNLRRQDRMLIASTLDWFVHEFGQNDK